MHKIEEYDEQSDEFTVRAPDGTRYFANAETLAHMLNHYDEPSAFLGMQFTTTIKVQA
jgi:hypothetical protein